MYVLVCYRGADSGPLSSLSSETSAQQLVRYGYSSIGYHVCVCSALMVLHNVADDRRDSSIEFAKGGNFGYSMGWTS